METKLFLNYPLYQSIGGRETKGDKVGVELELEGRNVALEDVATPRWKRHAEPSLRGESMEYTLAGPQEVEETKKLVNDLFDKFRKHGVVLNNSHRTSTHVHLNFSDKPLKKMVNFFCLFTMFEELLQYYSGEDRKGNLFCLSTREGEGIVYHLAEGLRAGNMHIFAGDRFKYGACNLSSLFKFGTVEVRTMRGADTAEQVNNWLDILNDMYQYALKMESPVDLVQDLSHVGADALLRKVFSPKSVRELLRTFPAIRTLHHSLMDGARIIQVLAYEFDGDFRANVEPPKPKKVGKGQVGPIPTTFRRPDGGMLMHLQIYHAGNGGMWSCFPPRGIAFWTDGMACRDSNTIIYRENIGRFVYRDRAGIEWPCKWRHHPNIPDEGRPLAHELANGGQDRWLDDPEEDEDVDFDEDDEIDFDED